MTTPTIPEEVVERMARAMWESRAQVMVALGAKNDVWHNDFDCLAPSLRAMLLGDVRAALAAIGPEYAVVPVEIDARTLCAVLMIAREKATAQDKRTAAAAATLAGASPRQMQIGTEIGAEMARDYRYIVKALTASRQEDSDNG